jgi:antitoxin component YwqK of YwqJK toxin-antitoxin module
MKLITIIGIFIISIGNYAQTEKPNYEFEIIRTDIIYEHNADTTLTKLYNSKNELLNGKYKIIHEDSTETYVNFKKGLWDGLYKSYYKTGELYAVIPFENGIKKDTGIWYYKNGNLNREIPYLNRKQHGICKWYYENGNLKKECEYLNDKENGICKWYFENGNIQTLVTYKNGFKNGLFELYNENGEITKQGYFLKDKEVTKKQFEKSK